MALCDILYKRLRNTLLTYLLTYHCGNLTDLLKIFAKLCLGCSGVQQAVHGSIGEGSRHV